MVKKERNKSGKEEKKGHNERKNAKGEIGEGERFCGKKRMGKKERKTLNKKKKNVEKCSKE